MRKPKTSSCHKIASIDHTYYVIMERLKNTTYGQPRWKATIIREDVDIYETAYTYTFQGHYMSELMEAMWILDKHEESEGNIYE